MSLETRREKKKNMSKESTARVHSPAITVGIDRAAVELQKQFLFKKKWLICPLLDF